MSSRTRRQFLRNAGAVAAMAGIAPSPRLKSDPRKTGSAEKLRGLMVDAARVPESLDYYRRVIDFCADWELNALQFRLADDQGCALRFASAPGLVTHKNALTPAQMRDLAEYAQSHGVDLIPEIESFGHTGFITRSPAYAHLLDSDPRGNSEFTGIIPVHPETLPLFEKLYREIAQIFPSPWLHGGCDEVNWGGSALSQKALATRTRAQIWAGYLNSLDRVAHSLGKQFIVWGDFVLHKEPEILTRLNKSIVVMDWNYRDTEPGKIRNALLKVKANGSRAIGAPALINYRWGPRAGREQLRNIDAFAESYFDAGQSASLGVILTNWVPSRYIQNSIWDGLAYAAIAFKEGSAPARASAWRRFVALHYGAEWNASWGDAFELIYAAAPSVRSENPSPAAERLRIPWSSDEELAAALRNGPPGENRFTRLRSLLQQVESSVEKNAADFRAFSLCAECLEAMVWRDAAIHEKPQHLEAATDLIARIAGHDRQLAAALTADWDSGRPADSEAKLQPLFGLEPKDQLLFSWRRAADYSSLLVQHPERFHRILTS
ncbi:MAG TPA: family 20 glycosylhydrolase [Terracidiphilus sp.]|nr:family 20 glycosylhydrolase [Terracidiphilus sp.]